MRFEAIKATNYRQYRNILFEFKKKTANDIHVIIASNGVGKTNLLNAVNWCLYGDEPHTTGAINTNNDKLPLCNLEAIAEAKVNEEEFCEVNIEIIASEGASTFVISRTSKVNVRTQINVGKDDFEIIETKPTGDTIIHRSDAAKEIVNRYLPQKIREYFYFDSERLLNYFDAETNKISHIKDSIYEIAQVNVINEVEKHLGDFEKQYNSKISKLSPDVEKKLQAVQYVQGNIDNIKKEIAKLDEQIEEAERAITEANSIINGTETVVEDNKKYDRNNEEIKRYEVKLEKAKKDLALFVRKYTMLIYLYKKNKATEEYILQSAESGAMTLDTSVDVIKQSLEEHQCRICGNQLNESAEEYLQSLVDRFMSNATIQKLTEIKNDVYRGLDISHYEEDKQTIYDSIDEFEEKIDELTSENDTLQKRISTVSNVELIENEMNRKINNEKTRDRNIEKRGSYKKDLENKEHQLGMAQKEYKDAIAANDECDDLNKHLDFVTDAKTIVTTVSNEIVTAVKSEMETVTMQIFESLLWKQETYSRIELDDNFRLKLFHKASNLSCLNSCSAAEKQLLALAFTIALHKVSGYDNLLFIDTPVGRVSDVNRENFAKVLLDISDKKQIILTFTPSEYSDEIKEVFNDVVVSSFNYLSTDEVTTEIKAV